LENVTWKAGAGNKPVPILHFIHCGSSCGYPGGGNNTSPVQPELAIQVPKLPARAVIRLWHAEPATVKIPPDMMVYLDLI